ncbi:MAG: type I polyketide synthase [Phycisphaerales bacterium]
MPTRDDYSGNELAVVGMSCRFPAARDLAEYWKNLREGVAGVRRYTDEELNTAGVEAADLRDPSYVRSGGPLEGMELFDASFFGYSPKDAAIMDPQHRHFMECSWEALEHAGHPPGRFKGSIGVFAGCGMNAYFMSNVLSHPELVRSVGLFLLRHTGNDRDFMPTGVSYKLNLRGPSVAVQTACSSSLVAVHIAGQSVLAGECDMALAGGVSIILPHRHGYHYRENEVQARDGRCCAFDHRASGTVLTSGVGVVVLRRLEDAIKDGDTVHAVIRGSAINNDGAGKVGYLAPSVDGHAAVVAEALALAGLTADDISYVEAHGTGTAVGDPIEIAALTQAFRKTTKRRGFCRIGSVKTAIGHLDTAAGVASLIKVVGALKHRQLPASLNFEAPNPAIDFENSPFVVNARLTDWSTGDEPRRAGISSLGVGGTNAHVIVEEPPVPIPTDPPERYEILAVSAKTPSALDAASANLAALFGATPDVHLGDAAHTLQVGREAFEHRRVVAVGSAADAADTLRSRDPKRVFTGRAGKSEPGVVFMFPGGGAQYPNMGREIYETQPVYARELDRCLDILRPMLDFDLRALMLPTGSVEDAAARLEKPLASVCAVFSVEYALAQLWMSWGVKPVAMTGHSLGEYTAACLAGVMSLEDALKIVALRGRLVERVADAAMLSVPLSEDQIAPLLGDDLDIAAVNAPKMCVVAGRSDRLADLESTLAAKEIDSKRLRLAAASHTRLLEPILAEFRAGIGAIRLSKPTLPYISNVTGAWVRDEDAVSPDYWVRHFRRTVRFSQGVAELLKDPNRVLLEVGPGQTLGSLAKQQPVKPAGVLSSLRHPEEASPDLRYLLSAFGRLWAAGVNVDWSKVRTGKRRRRITLPTYPFERQKYWIDPAKPATVAAETPPTSLERLARVDDWFFKPVWMRRDARRPAASAKPAEKRPVLVFLDAAGLGSEVARRLKARGDAVVTVRQGDAYYKLKDGEFALAPEGGREGYDQLISELAATNQLPGRIVHLWMVTADESFRPGSSFFHGNQERGFYSLLFLAQAMGATDVPAGLHIDVVSTGMQSVASELIPYPEKATLLGPARVIPREFHGVTCRSLDLVLPPLVHHTFGSRALHAPLAPLADRLVEELDAPAGNRVAALRDGVRYEQEFEPGAPAPDATDRLRPGGVYLITGGAGGIGLRVAEHLSREVKAKLVLVGRSPLPDRAEWDSWLAAHPARDPVSRKIRRLLDVEKLGGEVMIGCGDVADIDAMTAVVEKARAKFGAIHGVIHAAGAIEDGVIQSKTPEACERVFTPKVHGTMLLADLLRGKGLDFFAVFSSTSAIMGPAGQADYAAANAFLDAFASSRHASGLGRVVAINWGVWRDIGMATGISRRLVGAGANDPHDAGAPIHPLLDERVSDAVDEVVYTSRFAARKHWILDEHRTRSGRAVVPGTGYLEIARAAFADAAGTEQVDLRDVTFVGPLAVGDDEPRDVRVTLRPDADAWTFEVSSRASTNGPAQWDLHAQGSAAAVTGAPRSATIGDARARCLRPPPSEFVRQDAFLAFGPRWNVVKSVRYGENEALAELELPEEFREDLAAYKLHPAMMDMATGFGLPLVPGYAGSDALYVPMGYRRLRMYGPVPQRAVSVVRSDPKNHANREFATFDVTIADESGRVVVEIEQFTVRRTAGSEVLSAPADRAPAESTSEGGAADRAAPLALGERLFLEIYENGIHPDDGMDALTRVLRSRDGARFVASSVDLRRLIERTDAAAAAPAESGVKFSRPELASAYEAPRDEIEKHLAEAWTDLLGVDKVGIRDSFFDLGGHSLIAVRLFAKIKKAHGLDLPLATLFEAPTIGALGDVIREAVGADLKPGAGGAPAAPRRKFRYLVPMNQVQDGRKPPFFLVAGMFGNVLNLRHLSAHLGKDRPVYAIQARGLLGDDKPHTTFEEMSKDYLEEVRAVQPNGPYFLGGFSGGGITALEMALQLTSCGERVGVLVMLDSIPTRMLVLTRAEKLRVQWHRLRTRGLRYIADWVLDKAQWEWKRVRRIFRKPVQEMTPAEFRSEEIHIAFMNALPIYNLRPYSGGVHLFRPRQIKAIELAPGRVVNDAREFIDPHNFWDPWITGGIEVQVVPGDHDSMILEPHVRVLGAKLKSVLDEAQAREAGLAAKPAQEPAHAVSAR